MLERVLVAPLPLLDDTASTFPMDLGHGFSLHRCRRPDWLEPERKGFLFLSKIDIEELDKKEYWLTLSFQAEDALGQAEQHADAAMDLLLFLTTLLSPCYGMFMPVLLIEKSSSSPRGSIRQISGLRESHQLYLPEMLRHNAVTEDSLRKAVSCLARCQSLQCSKELTFKVAGTLWSSGFRQHVFEVQLLLWVMGLESLLGSSDKCDFVERLQVLIDTDEEVYGDGVWNRHHVRRDSGYRFKDLVGALYDARGQIAHGQAVAESFLERLQQELSGRVRPKTFEDKQVPLLEILMETSCILLQRLLTAALMDPDYFFLVGGVSAREQRFRARLANRASR